MISQRGMWWSFIWDFYSPKNLESGIFLAVDLQRLCQCGHEVSPFPGVCMQYVLTSCHVTSDYNCQSLHQGGLDFMDCNPASAGGHHHIIVAIDYFTKWADVIPTFKSDDEIVAHFIFNQIITQFNILKELVTDHGRNFQNKMME